MIFKKALLFIAPFVFFCSCISQPTPEPGKEFVEVGSQVPTFSVEGKDGAQFTSPEDFKGKTTLLMFFTTWCPDCKQQIPHVNEAWNHFKDNADIQFICIARGGSGSYIQTPEMVAQYWADNNLSMQWFLDPFRDVFNMFAESNVPRFYLIDSTGKILWIKVTYKYTSQQFIDTINQFTAQ